MSVACFYLEFSHAITEPTMTQLIRFSRWSIEERNTEMGDDCMLMRCAKKKTNIKLPDKRSRGCSNTLLIHLTGANNKQPTHIKREHDFDLQHQRMLISNCWQTYNGTKHSRARFIFFPRIFYFFGQQKIKKIAYQSETHRTTHICSVIRQMTLRDANKLCHFFRFRSSCAICLHFKNENIGFWCAKISQLMGNARRCHREMVFDSHTSSMCEPSFAAHFASCFWQARLADTEQNKKQKTNIAAIEYIHQQTRFAYAFCLPSLLNIQSCFVRFVIFVFVIFIYGMACLRVCICE